MVGENIKKLRTERGMTQKALADQLFVTPQAVSRWENGEVEPSISTVSDIAKIFQVTSDEILGIAAPAPEPEEKKEESAPEPQKQILALCSMCNRAIYNEGDIRHRRITHTTHHGRRPIHTSEDKIICVACEEKLKQQQAAELKRRKEEEYNTAKKARMKSYIFGGLTALVFFIIALACLDDMEAFTVWAVIGAFSFFLVSCLFLKNNFVGDMVGAVASWGIHFPGLIFELSLDGIIWFLTVKLIMFLITAAISILCFFLALALGFVVSVFVYPFALVKSFRKPGETETL